VWLFDKYTFVKSEQLETTDLLCNTSMRMIAAASVDV